MLLNSFRADFIFVFPTTAKSQRFPLKNQIRTHIKLLFLLVTWRTKTYLLRSNKKSSRKGIRRFDCRSPFSLDVFNALIRMCACASVLFPREHYTTGSHYTNSSSIVPKPPFSDSCLSFSPIVYKFSLGKGLTTCLALYLYLSTSRLWMYFASCSILLDYFLSRLGVTYEVINSILLVYEFLRAIYSPQILSRIIYFLWVTISAHLSTSLWFQVIEIPR